MSRRDSLLILAQPASGHCGPDQPNRLGTITKMNLKRSLPILFAVLSLALYATLFWPTTPGPDIVRLLIVAMVLGGLYLSLLAAARRLSLFGSDRPVLLILAVVAISIRLLVVFGADERTYQLSNDVNRHIWEGGLVANGYNPYAVIPESFERSGMADDDVFGSGESMATEGIAPPLAQILFAVAFVSHSDSIAGFKVLSLFFELMTILGLVLLIAPEVRRRPFKSWAILIWAFSPLVLIEFLLSNHLDIFAIPFLVFALVWLRRQSVVWCGIMLGLAALIKTFALLLAPVILFHLAGHQRWRFAAGMIVTMAIVYLPFLPGAGLNVVTSTVLIPLSEHFAGSVFLLLRLLTGETVALWASGLLLAAVVIGASSVLKQRLPQVEQRLFVVVGAATILAPGLYPWYLVWVLPFVVLFRAEAFLVLSVTVLLSYHTLIGYFETGEFSRNWVLVLLQYAPFYGLLILEWLRLRTRHSSPAAQKT